MATSVSVFTAIRNVGSNVVKVSWPRGESEGRFVDFNDFLSKAPAQACNKRVVESLVKAGASMRCSTVGVLVAVHEVATSTSTSNATRRSDRTPCRAGLDEADTGFGVSVEIPDISPSGTR